MKVSFHITPEFERMAKPLAKKYKSFESDYDTFLNELSDNPLQGTSLGSGIYKVRMAIASKGKGKSGGYDKGEISNVSDAYIKQLLKQIDG